MSKLSAYTGTQFVKILYIGDSSTGKTGSLASLVGAGYQLRILDLDNGLQILKQFIMKDFPDKIDTVDAETRSDKYKFSAGGAQLAGIPKAFVDSTKLLNQWSDGTIPSEWGDKTIFVLDSLTALGKAALAWAESMNPGVKDPRQWYNVAQQALEKIIMMLTSDEFRAHVIVISHVNYQELVDGSVKGYASAVGKALGPHLPKYFNTLVLAESQNLGKSVRRRIKTVSTATIDLKTPAPFKIDADLPLETGLATLFDQIKHTQGN